jgi:chromosome segregation ATPase
MSSNKRKSGDVFSQSNRGPAVVVVNTAPPKDDAAIQAQLQKLRQHVSEDDHILMAMENIGQGAYEPEGKLQKEASSVKLQLEQKLEQSRDACQHESRVLIDMANRIESITGERTSLIQDMEKLDKQQIDLQRNISKYQEEASQEIESIDQVEEEQKRQVPRLKTQISLYASTTGIKWDFSQDHILSGQVVSCSLSSKSVLKRPVYSASSSSSSNPCFLY